MLSLYCFLCIDFFLFVLILFFGVGWVHCRVGVMSWFPMSCQTKSSNSWLMVGVVCCHYNCYYLSCDSLLYFVHLTSSWKVIDLSEFLHYTWMSAYSKTNWNLGTSIFSANKTDRHDIAEILLKVTLNTITITILCLLSGLK